MGQIVPSVLVYSQAAELLEELEQAQAIGAAQDTAELIQELSAVLQNFLDEGGAPLLDYDPVYETEPPLSEKTNKFWSRAARDINLMRQQVDILRAATVFTHNIIATDINHARNDNQRVNNKLKTLQMYSNSLDSSIITFGDTFQSLDFADESLVTPFERAALFYPGYVSLAREGELVNLSQNSSIKILDTSNGFLGNNREIEDPSIAPVDPESGRAMYVFKAELRDYDNLADIVDEEPNTWIEYEKYHLTTQQKLSADNLNFVYTKLDLDSNMNRVDWATGPDDGVLRLGLEFDFGQIRNLNSINLTPYGLEENLNYPILIRQVQTSADGTDWQTVFPTELWIGNDTNLRTARTARNVVIGQALWAFESRAVRYVRVFIEQHHSVPSNVGHMYWVDRDNPDKRIEGPIPSVDEPNAFMDRWFVGRSIQKREYFEGRRWAIGIRDLIMQQVEYRQKSVLITKRLRVGGLVDRVMLEEADIMVPNEYDTSQHWVKFFISPDDGENWYQISRISDPNNGIPQQISFNDPLHPSLREGSVANYTTDVPVTSIRLKVELTRPADKRSTTPVLKSYRLKVKRR